MSRFVYVVERREVGSKGPWAPVDAWSRRDDAEYSAVSYCDLHWDYRATRYVRAGKRRSNKQ